MYTPKKIEIKGKLALYAWHEKPKKKLAEYEYRITSENS